MLNIITVIYGIVEEKIKQIFYYKKISVLKLPVTIWLEFKIM